MQNVLPRSRSAYLDSECRNRAISFDSGTSTSAQSSPSTAKLWRPVRPSVQPNFRVAPGVKLNIGLLCRTPLSKSAADSSDLGIRMDFDEAHPLRPMHAVWLSLQGFASWQAACYR